MGVKKKKRLIKADDLCRLNEITSLALAPDEKQIAYTVETVAEDKKKYFSHIHVVDCDSGRSRRFTFGEVNDRGLAWSPDGEYIAFISTREKKTGIYVIPFAGGGARRVIQADGTFTNLVWTPDGKELIYTFRYNDSHNIKDETKKKEPPVYRHITRLAYRLDGSGFLPQDRFHIWKVNVGGGRAKQLTRGKHNDAFPAVSPDGNWIVFVSNRSKEPDVDAFKIDLFIMPLRGGKPRNIPTPPGPVLLPAFAPNGKKIAYVGKTGTDDLWGVRNLHVWTVGIHGKPAARDLMPDFDRTASDRIGLFMQPLHWSPDGERIYFVATDTGSTHIFYVPAGGGRPRWVTGKPCHVKDHRLNGRMKHIAAVVSNPKTPGELHLMPAARGGDRKARVLAAPNKKLLSGIHAPRTKEVWFAGDDGTRLQGWLVTPPRLIRRRKYPAILQIHGGPVVQYGFTFYHEMLWLASKGYVVFYTNPRGSAGRGEAFAHTIVTDYGTTDGYNDCLAAADYLANLPSVDQNRMGVTGGSYGGFMTNWIIGHTDRFRAAITQRSLVDLQSWVGQSNEGWNRCQSFGGYPWTKPEEYVKYSPLTYAKNINTPLLIIHSENDFRANIGQAEQLFTTLKLMKKKVEFVRFPEEPHGLRRHGRPDRRVARLEWIVKWFDRYLK